VLAGQGKVTTHPVPQENTAVSWEELRGNPGEENLEVADKVYIPDYVVHDFGFPKSSRSYQ
jgi:hypothetical protein